MTINQEKEVPVAKSMSKWRGWYRYLLLVAFVSIFVLLFVLYDTTLSQPPKKPNIILILSDDQGYNDVGVYGSSDALTPNIDALAESGIRFEQFYAGGPVCTPTRYGLLTGRHVNRSPDPKLAVALGANARRSGLRKNEVTVADALLEEGYQTAIIGKWHLGIGGMPADPPGTGDPDSEFHPNNHGMEYFYGNLSGAIDYNTHWNRDKWLDWFENKEYIAGGESGQYATHLFTAKAVDFIDSNANNTSPFFLYLPYTAPHFGNTAGGGGPVVRTQLPVGEEVRREYLSRFDHIYSDDHNVRKRYLAMVAVLDDGVGEIVEAVQRNGILEDTIIIYISDNGGAPSSGGSNIPLRGTKGTMYEGGIRVPAMIVWQGVIKPDQTSQQLAMVTDIFPTLFSIAAPDKNSYPTDGIDLGPHLFDGEIIERDISFSNWLYGEVYRRGDWKFVRPIDGEDELYNLNSDLGEQNNLAASNPNTLFELKRLHCEWLQSMENDLPTTRGRLFVDKVTQPASDPQKFAFTLFGGPDCLLQDFIVNDSADPWDSGYLKTGTYQVIETTPTGWIQVEETCDDGSNPQNILLDADETVTCTFTNRELAYYYRVFLPGMLAGSSARK